MAYIKEKTSPITVEDITAATTDESRGIPVQPFSTAAASSESPVSGWLILSAYLLVALSTFLGYMIAARWIKPTPLKLVSVEGLTLFAIFYILAAAVERLVDPLKNLIFDVRKKEAINKRDYGKAAGNLQQAADGQAELNQTRADSGIVTWAIATTFAMLGTSATGLFFLHAIGIEGVSLWLDILITGLAIGAGTKPLHDLIGYIENKNVSTKNEGSVYE
ncbi:MAG: hypothetical protein V2J07_01240 [Anaerolineae bacterium]|jgi:hypothetical protein|nr:hypothetical protein [Anaerolineae bacterium]